MEHENRPARGVAPLVLACLAGGIAACASGDVGLDPEHLSLYAEVEGIDGVAFYPPLGPEPIGSGPFDSTLVDGLSVLLEASGDRAEWTAVATFDDSTTPRVALLAARERYWVGIPAAAHVTDPAKTYRVRVLLDGTEIGSSVLSPEIFSVMRHVPTLDLGVQFRVEGSGAVRTVVSQSQRRRAQGTPRHCSDGLRNKAETGVDCGGGCADCPTCADGIQNQGEERVDCGGPCASCCPIEEVMEVTYGSYADHLRVVGKAAAIDTAIALTKLHYGTVGLGDCEVFAWEQVSDTFWNHYIHTYTNHWTFQSGCVPSGGYYTTLAEIAFRVVGHEELCGSGTAGSSSSGGTGSSSGGTGSTSGGTGSSSGGTGGAGTSNPTPVLSAVSPATAVVGDGDLVITVDGTGFLAGAFLRFGGTPLTTAFESSTRLTALVPATELATLGNFGITAENPSPSAGPSAALTFTVAPPAVGTLRAPGTTCRRVLQANPGTPSGVYWLQDDGGQPYQAYCDMTTDGGGWTVIYAARNGSANVFGHFDSGAHTPSCSDPGAHCIRRAPAALWNTQADIAVSCGSAMVKFPMNIAVGNYFTSGVRGNWFQIRSTNIGTAALRNVPDYFYAGGTSATGFALSAGGGSGSYTFAGGYDANPNYDYCNGVADTTSLVRVYYREAATLEPLNAASDALASCRTILDAGRSAGSGVYWIQPAGVSQPFTAFCDMTTDGGGWTTIFAGRNGSPNVFDRFDAGYYTGICTDPALRCLRRLPASVQRTAAEIAVSVGGAMVKFGMTNAVGNYLTSGTQANWLGPIQAANIGSTAPVRTPNYIYAGGASNGAGFALTAGGGSGSYTFAAILGSNTSYDYGNGVADVTSTTRIAYRELPPLSPLNASSEAAVSCKAILDAGLSRGSGLYWIRPIGEASAYTAYCDMVRDGGGWTAILASRNGSPNVVDYFDANAFAGICTDPTYRCVRRLPSSILNGQAEIAVSVGASGMVKFPMTVALGNYLGAGTRSGWARISPTNIGSTAPTYLPDFFLGGTPPSSSGFALTYGGNNAGYTFASSYDASTTYDYAMNVVDTTSLIRLYYREVPALAPLSSASEALASCRAILAAGQGHGSGVYYIQPLGVAAPYLAYCDMTTDGGGWTAVYAARNGSPNVFDHFDGHLGVCTDPATRCVRRVPQSVADVQSETLVAVDNAAVKFATTSPVIRYLTQGTQAGWTPVQASSVGSTTVRTMPDYLFTGSGASNAGFVFSSGGNSGPSTFVGASSASTSWDYANGTANASSMVRLFYREAAQSVPLNTQADALASCAAILAAGRSQGDGVYFIQPAGEAAPFAAYCDMTRDGGGWTAIYAARSGSFNVFDHFDAGAYLGTCTDPAGRCVRRASAGVSATYAAVACGAAMVKFPLTTAVRAYFTSGTQAGWQPVTPTNIGTVAPRYSPNYLFTGSNASTPGFALTSGGNSAGYTFAAGYSASTSYDYCNGVYDLNTLVRVFYR